MKHNEPPPRARTPLTLVPPPPPPVLPLRSPSGGEESDDEDRIRATRERLRERRKHRNRARHHPHAHAHDQEALPSRPRAKSATSTIPPRAPVLEAGGISGSRTRGGHSGVSVDRKRGHSSAAAVGSGSGGGAGGGAGAGGVEKRKHGGSVGRKAGGVGGGAGVANGGSVLVTPIPSLRRWLFSTAAVPWLLLALVFLVEALEYARFSSETAGFLEAAETALAVLEERGGGAAAAATGGGGAKAALKEELARGLVRIYSRHRFVWPFNRLQL